MTRAPAAVPFYFVDVFAVRPLTGNPVTVVPDADGPAVTVSSAGLISATGFLHL